MRRYGPKYQEWISDTILSVNIYDIEEKYAGKRNYEYSQGIWTIRNEMINDSVKNISTIEK